MDTYEQEVPIDVEGDTTTGEAQEGDPVLEEHLCTVCRDEQPSLSPCVSYMTYGLLSRLQSMVWSRSSTELGMKSKQRVLARVVASVTGGRVPSWESAERPGQRMQTALHRHRKEVEKVRSSERKAASRARSHSTSSDGGGGSGGAASSAIPCSASSVASSSVSRKSERVRDLDEQVYKCEYGCTPAVLPRSSIPPGLRPRTVESEVCHLSELNVALVAKCHEVATEAQDLLENMRGEVRVVKRDLTESLRTEAEMRRLAAQNATHAAQAEEETTSLKVQVRDLRHQADMQQRDTEAAQHRLGGLVARKQQEAEVEAVRAAKLRDERTRIASELEAERKRGASELRELRVRREAELQGERERAAAELQGERERAAAELQAERERARAELQAERERLETSLGAEVERAVAEEKRRKERAVAREKERAEVAQKRAREEFEAKEAVLAAKVAHKYVEAEREALRAEKLQKTVAVQGEQLHDLEEGYTVEHERRMEAERVRNDAVKTKKTVQETSKKRLEAKKELLERIDALRATNDELQETCEELQGQLMERTDAVQKIKSMPSWRREREGNRGGLKLSFVHRVQILEQHGNGTPPSAIGKNIVSTVKATAPWLEPVEPTVGEIRKIGFELTTIEEALSARRVASAYRVRLLGFDETTDRQEPSITSNVQVEATKGAALETVILKAAYLSTKGGESEAVVDEIEGKCFQRLRELLVMWKEYHQKHFPQEEWTGPDPDSCSLHRLAGGGGIQSDSCNAALKAKRLLRDLIRRQQEAYSRKQLGDEVWEAFSEEERERRLRVHTVECHQHLRNIFLSHMSARQAAHVKAELGPQLDQFQSWERMSTDFQQLLRAVYKEFHQGGKYYKGKGADFRSWLLEHHPTVCYFHLERAEGGRQDLDFDAPVPIYFNRPYLYEYLHTLVFASNHSNILEDFLYTVLGTDEYIAMARANAIIDLLISRPLRWLAGKSAELNDWSPYKMNDALDLVDSIFKQAKDNGNMLLDPTLQIFKPVADEQPLFREYLQYTFTEDAILSPDGKVRHHHFKQALSEVLQPQDDTNRRTTQKTIQYLQVQCTAGLEKMHDTKLAIADKLTGEDGANAFAKQTEAHQDLKGCDATNDALAESVYGAYKQERRMNPGISQRRASGRAQSRLMKSMAHGDAIQHRRQRKAPSAKAIAKRARSRIVGYFHSLRYSERWALVEMARVERQPQRRLDQQDQEELDAFRAARRKTNSELELESLVKQFALALSFFDRFKERGVHDMAELERELHGLQTSQARLDYLREQIEMRVVGLSWVEFRKHWSSSKDEDVGTVEDLKEHMREILDEEAERQIPDVAPAPIMQRKTFKELGTKTVQAEQLSNQRLSLSGEELLDKARAERRRLEVAGVLDTMGDKQPKTSPKLDASLVGRKIEVRWRYWRPAQPGEKGSRKQEYIWVEGTIVEVSDGTIRKSKRSQDSLPAGAVRIRWPPDKDFNEKESFSWSILNPADWNREVHLGWRWAASELAVMREDFDEPLVCC